MYNDKKGRKFHAIVINLIRFLLLLALFGAYYNGRHLVMFIAGFAFLVTLLPSILYKFWKIKIPAQFEVIVILFIYGTLFFGEVRGFYAEFWWWDVLLNLFASFALGLIGLTVLYTLYRNDSIEASPLIISFFAFSFAVAMGGLWEIFEYTLDSFWGFNLQKTGLEDTMKDLIVNFIGAFFVSLAGYFYIRTGRLIFVSTIITKFMDMNPKFFGIARRKSSAEELKELIKEGENARVEFKATLRMNLYTNQIDLNVERANLKTLVAFMNSEGGKLIVGVSDEGKIEGMERDGFQNNDKIGLHFTNLIKSHIGSEYLPYLNFEVVEIDDKSVLFVRCRASEKEVFLKYDKTEEFYVRNGPASVKLSGRALVEYIKNRF